MDDVVLLTQYRPLPSWLPPKNRTPWHPPLLRQSDADLDEQMRTGPLPMTLLHALLTRRLKIED